MYRANRGYPGNPPGGLMGHESLEDYNQELEGELKVWFVYFSCTAYLGCLSSMKIKKYFVKGSLSSHLAFSTLSTFYSAVRKLLAI